MKKEDFLSALRERIAVLERSEQEDILAEYAQHIQMQMEQGRTEEEAIRDFGSLEELAADILEAYHIDPEYQAGVQPAAEPLGRRVKEGARQLSQKTAQQGNALLQFWRRFCEKIRSGWQKCRGWFHRRPAATAPKTARGKGTLAAIGRGLGNVLRGCLRLVQTLLRFGWNAALVLCAFPLTAALVLGLIGLGVQIVMLTQNMPVIGTLLITLGGMLVCFALLCLGSLLIWRRSARQAAKEDVQ